MNKSLAVLAVVTLALTACGSEGADDEAMDEIPVMGVTHTVSIMEPSNGSTVAGPRLTVRLQTNVPIVQAGDMTPGTGHHHLFLDGDLSPEAEPIPAVPGTVVHLGDGSSEFTFDAVRPGQHRLIAVVADGAHVPLRPLVTDTVIFTVQE